ncbi:hypothetical protein [Bradyrhizobium sp. Y36]|uniref:hypothetical protein n=1 Tax=Bradyrhizobium sp. Y36 TaxID=2035447 RepID=UPI001178307C|nr:hypothetical protein [Bradyrhizobium sp. Y36]
MIGILLIMAIAHLWLFMPRNGQPHRSMGLPFFETAIPLVIVMALSAGLTMVVEQMTSRASPAALSPRRRIAC